MRSDGERQNEKSKRRLAKLHPEMVNSGGPGSNTPGASSDRGEAVSNSGGGPQLRLINGQIVIDDRSLVVDRHERPHEADMEVVEENEFTRITTSGSFMKREKNYYWSDHDTDKFYDGLRMFGTDFEMISKMFPGRNRRQVKLKFNKEEKVFPKKVASALIGEKVAIDLEEYSSHTRLTYEKIEDIEAERDRIEEEHEEEQRRHDEEAAEVTRQKKAAISGILDGAGGAGGADSAKENEPDGGAGAIEDGKVSAASRTKKKGPAKRKKRNLHSVRGGGEEVQILGAA